MQCKKDENLCNAAKTEKIRTKNVFQFAFIEKKIDDIIVGLSRCKLSVKSSMKEQMESLYKLAKSKYIIHFSALFSASLRGCEIAQSSNTV